ncbi:MAG TPA: hypothetical protein VLA33_12430 [Gemmatimonadota bacterium]|nr:hypothetical protein [Gemmatimonadota bacterium]
MSILEIGGLALIFLVLVAAARGKVRVNAREVSDLEARLRPIAGAAAAPRAAGSAEREEWDDGSAEFEAHVRGLDLPDGTEIEFVVEGVTIGRAVLTGGRARLEYDSRDGDDVPPVADGQRLVIRHGGTDLLEGSFRPD